MSDTPARPKGRKRELQLAADWQEIYATAAGKRVISDLMAWCEVYNPIEEKDPIRLAMAVGVNNVAKRIAGYLGLKPHHYPETSWEDLDLLERVTRSQH